MNHKPYTIQGNFSKEFLESMGLKRMEFPLFETSRNPTMEPLQLVKMAYEKISLKGVENRDWGRKPRRTLGLDWKKENRGD